MKDIWLISDTHFGHANILTFRHGGPDGPLIRGSRFSSVQEMDEAMIENWNKVVKPGDKVYHLGDVMFGDKADFLKKFRWLHGQKRLVVGNHDDIKFFVQNELFSKISLWRMFPEFGVVLTHIPLHNTILYEGRFKGAEAINIHGHLHQNPSPTPQHFNVSVEQIDFTPIHIEEVLKRVRNR